MHIFRAVWPPPIRIVIVKRGHQLVRQLAQDTLRLVVVIVVVVVVVAAVAVVGA